MKPEDLPTPKALEELLKEFVKKTAAEPPHTSLEDKEENDLAEELHIDPDEEIEFLTQKNMELENSQDSEEVDGYDADEFEKLLDKFVEDMNLDKEKAQSADNNKSEASDDSDYDLDDDDTAPIHDLCSSEENDHSSDATSDSSEDGTESEDDKEFQRLYENFLHEELVGSTDDDTQDNASEDETDPLEELMSMTGMEDVKKAVQQQLYYNRIMKMRQIAGKRVPQRLMHLLLTGNPGTGKTTVAKLIGRIYKKEGILRKGHLVEANRASLVGEFIGQSEKKTLETVEEAKGGILFIDEIYALAERQSENSDNKDFGIKVLDTLMPILDKVDSDLVVIGAGYPNKIRNFLNTNPGLSSRFPTVLEFKDFSVEELKEIAMNLLKKYDFTPTEEFLKGLDLLLKEAIKVKNHGNARMVHTLVNNFVIPNLCTRIALSEEPFTDIEQTSLVMVKDLPTLEELFPLAEKKRMMGFS